MTLYGYTRVSAASPTLNRSVGILLSEGVKPSHIYADRLTASWSCNGLDALKRILMTADIVLVEKMHQLGRDLCEAVALVEEFHEMGVSIRFVDSGLSIEGEGDKPVLNALSAVAKSEAERVSTQSCDSRERAIIGGAKVGRKPSIDRLEFKALFDQGLGATDIARRMGIGRSTVYKLVQSIKNDENSTTSPHK